MANHREMVFEHLKKYGSITPDEAKAAYGCARLAARINELRANGHDIKTEMVSYNGEHGKVSYARYTFEEVEQCESTILLRSRSQIRTVSIV